MKKAQDELAVTDKEIKTLKPQLQLETIIIPVLKLGYLIYYVKPEILQSGIGGHA